MKVVSVISTKIREGWLYTKLLKSGKSDVQDVKTASLPGIDSVPLEDDRALYEMTDVSGENFVIGFLVKNRKAEPGEIRFFSLNDNKEEEIFIHIKKNREIHFGGEDDNLTRYKQTADSINELKDSITDLKNLISGWTPVPNDGGAALKAVLATWFSTPLIEDITGAKIDELKTL